eukprot:178900-Rhodomonas_salina.4
MPSTGVLGTQKGSVLTDYAFAMRCPVMSGTDMRCAAIREYVQNMAEMNEELGTVLFVPTRGENAAIYESSTCLLYTSPSPRDRG